MKNFGLGHKKLEVEVPWNFETDKEIAVQLGRWYGTNGTIRMCYLVSTGEIFVHQPNTDDSVVGFGSFPRMQEST